MQSETVKPEARYVARKNCKLCYGRGVVIRTLPRGRKKQVAGKFRCTCVKEVKPVMETPSPNTLPEVEREENAESAEKL